MADNEAVTSSEDESKGGLGAISGASTINVGGQKISTKGPLQSAELLKAMEEEYARRTPNSGLGRFNTFLEGLKDAVAVTSHDPGSAMAQRDQQKRADEDSLFSMRANIASIKGQQAQQALSSKALDTIMNGTAGAPGTGGVAGSNGVKIPELIMKQMAVKRAQQDDAGAQLIYDNWVKMK